MLPVSTIDVTYLAKGVGVVVGDKGSLVTRASTLPAASGPPGLTEMITLGKDQHPSLATFDGKSFAAAGKSNTLAIVWFGANDVASGQPAGGVAVLECK